MFRQQSHKIQVFGEQWFKKYNKILCWFANSFLREFIFNFHKFGHYLKEEIIDITPNSVCEKLKDGQYRRHFFTRNEYALRLQKVFYPIWITFHIWDLITRPVPQLNLGFDTLTVYPDAGTGATTVDGSMRRHNAGEESWATLIAGAGSNAYPTVADTSVISMDAGGGSNKWTELRRSILTFDTHALTSGATISASVLSIYGHDKLDLFSPAIAPNIDIYTSTPAADNNLVAADFSQIGSTSQTGSPITYAGWSTAGYNDFTFNVTGRGNVSKTSISRFGVRNANYDVGASAPTWSNGCEAAFFIYFSDNATNKPKLVVTYTNVVGPANLKSYNTNLVANIKTINTNAIANVKSLDTNV